MKNSFILHIDSLCILDKLTDEQAGQFIKAIYQYQKNKELPELDALLALVLTPFLNQFSRDEIKYEAVAQRNRENGANGGRPPKNQANKPKKPTGLSETQRNPENPGEPRKPDSDSDSGSDSDSDSDSGSENEKDNLIPFDVFYQAYGFKRDRKDAEKAWNKLSNADRQKALDYISTYYKLKREWQETRYPATYLNKRTWEDEVAEAPDTSTVLRAVSINENYQVVYENGKIYGAPNWRDVDEVLAGRKHISVLDRKVS